MNVTFYQFAKKNNSTKIPTITGTTLSCQLKETTDMINPVLIIQAVPVSWNPIWNYCHIPIFNRYYFINNWSWLNGVWECSCAVDVLASWKTEIGVQEEYILRTDTTDMTIFNGLITDTVYPTTNQFDKYTYSLPSASSPFVSQLTHGVYIIGVINSGNIAEQDGSVGAITYYAMTPFYLELMKEQLLSDNNLRTMGFIDSIGNILVSDVSPETLKTMYNPYQYIVSCMWFPFTVNQIQDKTFSETMKIGWWTYSIPNYWIKAQTLTLTEDLGLLPWHPQAVYRGNYLNYEPYTKTTLMGRFGMIAIDSKYVRAGRDRLRLEYMIDLIEGLCLLRLISRYTENEVSTDTLFSIRSFQLGVPIQLAQVGIDYMGADVTNVNALSNMVGATLSSAANIATGNLPGAINGASNLIGSAANGIYNSINASMPQLETSGSNGSFISPLLPTTITQVYYLLTSEDIAHKGRPVCAIKQINTLSGFVLCAEGDFDIACLDVERTMIKNYLTSGFFFE